MRILVDEEDVPWDQAWSIVTQTFFFTNHTVLPVRLTYHALRILSSLLCIADCGLAR